MFLNKDEGGRHTPFLKTTDLNFILEQPMLLVQSSYLLAQKW